MEECHLNNLEPLNGSMPSCQFRGCKQVMRKAMLRLAEEIAQSIEGTHGLTTFEQMRFQTQAYDRMRAHAMILACSRHRVTANSPIEAAGNAEREIDERFEDIGPNELTKGLNTLVALMRQADTVHRQAGAQAGGGPNAGGARPASASKRARTTKEKPKLNYSSTIDMRRRAIEEHNARMREIQDEPTKTEYPDWWNKLFNFLERRLMQIDSDGSEIKDAGQPAASQPPTEPRPASPRQSDT